MLLKFVVVLVLSVCSKSQIVWPAANMFQCFGELGLVHFFSTGKLLLIFHILKQDHNPEEQ